MVSLSAGVVSDARLKARLKFLANIPFNLIFCLFLGLCLTASARTQLVSGAVPWRSDLFLPVLSFALLCIAPVAIYLYLAYRDWSWMYLVDPARLPPGTGLAVIVTTTLMVPFGYLLGWVLLRLLRPRGFFGILGGLGMAVLLLLAFVQKRLFFLGRFEDFLGPARLSRPLSQSKLFFALACIAPLTLLSFFVVAQLLWAQGRWLRQMAHQMAHQASRRSSEHERQHERQHEKSPSSP